MATNAAAPTGKLILQPNIPELIALKYPTGKVVESRFGDAQQVFFSLVDGRSAYLSLGVAQKIYALQLGNREEFYVCKKSTNKAPAGYVDVWLTPEGEQVRGAAQEPEPPSHLERQLAASITEAQNRKLNNGAGSVRQPAPPSPINRPHQVQHANQSNHTSHEAPVQLGWAQALLRNTNALVDIYAEACQHADQLSVPHAAVRTLLISAFIGQQKSGGPR